MFFTVRYRGSIECKINAFIQLLSRSTEISIILLFLKVDIASYVNVILNVYKNFIFASVVDYML